jgi:quercetin dioxygenase-like cupin family protein
MTDQIRRPFWSRSAVSDVAMVRHDGWAYRVLKWEFPGTMGILSAYVVTLDSGCSPHVVHNHLEEEIVVPLTGSVDIVLPGSATRPIGTRNMTFHAHGNQHTYRGGSEQEGHFVVLKWLVPGLTDLPPDNVVLVTDIDTDSGDWTESGGIRRRRIWDKVPLAAGGHLTAEEVEMAPKTGYPVHTHEHDLLLVLTHGQLTGLGHVTDAPAVIYYPAGTPHGAAASSLDVIRMFAFEFHPAKSMPWLSRSRG